MRSDAKLERKLRSGDWSNWESFLSRHCRVGALDILVDGYPPLFWAWHANRLDVFELLLKHRANPNTPNAQNHTLIEVITLLWDETHQAYHSFTYTKLLLDYGARTRPGRGRGVLACACAAGDLHLVNILLAHPKVDVNESVTCASEVMYSPVYEAAIKGHIFILKMLLHRHPNVFGQTKKELMEYYPDVASTRSGYMKCISMLLQYAIERPALARLAALGHVMIFTAENEVEQGARVADFASICPFVYEIWTR